MGATSRLRISGDAAPLSTLPSATIQAQIKELNLVDVTGYAQRNIGYQIDSGVFNADCEINIDQGQLQTQNHLFMNQLVLSKLEQDELTELDNQLGMPVNTAINLLRDADGTIELNIPVQGDLNNPEIKIGKVMRKAVSNAMKKSVLTVFAPLRLFGKNKDDAPLNEALRFKELPFAPVSIVCPPKSTDYLDEIAKIMKKHPGVSIRLNGVATQQDRDAMVVMAIAEMNPIEQDPDESKPASTRGFIPEGEIDPYAASRAAEAAANPLAPKIPDEALLDLADARAQVIKSYLVESARIEASRLFIGESRIDEESSNALPPRVEISL